MFSVISGASSPRGMWTITSRRAIDVPIRTHTHLVATTAANQKPNLFIEVTKDLLMAILLNNTNSNTLCHNK